MCVVLKLPLTAKYAMPRIGLFERVGKGIAYFMLGTVRDFNLSHLSKKHPKFLKSANACILTNLAHVPQKFLPQHSSSYYLFQSAYTNNFQKVRAQIFFKHVYFFSTLLYPTGKYAHFRAYFLLWAVQFSFWNKYTKKSKC